MDAVLAGLALGLSLIVAIGAQNVFVLRQGVRREHVAAVVVVCVVSDVVLIALGVAGLGRLVAVAPWAVDVARWGGVVFLLGYAVLAARRAADPDATGLVPDEPGGEGATGTTLVTTRATSVVATALALTWLNPHVYLDTVFLLGSVAATHGDERWAFAGGAMVGSVVWFVVLGFGAGLARGLLRSPTSWRVLDGVIAAVMVAMAAKLALG